MPDDARHREAPLAVAIPGAWTATCAVLPFATPKPARQVADRLGVSALRFVAARLAGVVAVPVGPVNAAQAEVVPVPWQRPSIQTS